jgi:hypothetical protein
MTFINFFKDERMLQKTSKALYDGVKKPLEGPFPSLRDMQIRCVGIRL